MKFVSNGFSKRFLELLVRSIGAIDGWLVRIGKSLMHKDSQQNPTSFYNIILFMPSMLSALSTITRKFDGYHFLTKVVHIIIVAFVKQIYTRTSYMV